MQQRQPTRLDHPYGTFRLEEMILRDFLAADRTVLANERTLLSYFRSALASFVAGISLLHFLEGTLVDIGGGLLCVIGPVLLVLGLVRYRQVRTRISILGEPPGDEEARAMLRARKDENV